VLYWFRTPPGVKVGRAALDEEAIRLIEQLNPGIEFDWTRILKGQGAPPVESRPPVDVRRQRQDNRRPQHSPAPAPPRPVQAPVRDVPVEARPADIAPIAPEPEIAPEIVFESAVADPTEGAGVEDGAGVGIVTNDAPTPAHAKLGSEGVQRLRARYAEILARISERTPDPLRREELKLQADRLNPDAWVTGEEVVQGLEQYESVFATLREVVGQKRRRRRRGSRPRPEGAGGDAEDTADSGDAPDSSESADVGEDSSSGES
jgi:hypothetical protein